MPGSARAGGAAPRWGLLAVALGTLPVPLDTAVNVAFAPIVAAFGLPIPAIQWVVIAYSLTFASLMLVFGRIGDMLGHRRLFLIGTAWIGVAFALCAAAPGFGALLAARVLQGVGAALVLSCGPALATSLYDEARRPRVLAFYTVVFGVGTAAGPLVGGLLLRYWGWPSVYGFRVPIALAAFLMGWLLPADARPARRARFDAAGAVLLVLAIGALLAALGRLQAAGRSLPWLALLGTASLAAGAGFVARERRTAEPIIDLRCFRDADFALLTLGHALLNLSAFAVMLLVPFYLDRVGGLSVTVAGLALGASPLGIVLAAPLAGRASGTVGPWRLALVGAVCVMAGGALVSLFGARPALVPLTGALAVQGFGLGLFQVAYFDIATATIPRRDRGVAGSLVMMTRTLGVVLGASLLMLAFQYARDASAASDATGLEPFLAGFRGAFRFAAATALVVVAGATLRGWGARPCRRD